jgi:hypothetical protein
VLVGRHRRNRRDTDHRPGSRLPDNPISRHHRAPPMAKVLVSAISLACPIGSPWTSDTSLRLVDLQIHLCNPLSGIARLPIFASQDHGGPWGFKSGPCLGTVTFQDSIKIYASAQTLVAQLRSLPLCAGEVAPFSATRRELEHPRHWPSRPRWPVNEGNLRQQRICSRQRQADTAGRRNRSSASRTGLGADFRRVPRAAGCGT